MNSVNLIGNLTRDPELKFLPSGTAILNCNVAVSRSFKNQNGEYESDFINFKAFGKTAELIANHFSRGSKIGLTGSIQTGKYNDNDGKTVYTTDVLVNSITFVEKKEQSTQAPQTTQATNYGRQQGNNGQTNLGAYPADDPFYNSVPQINDNDLPF